MAVTTATRSEASIAIRTDLGAIFVSLELSCSTDLFLMTIGCETANSVRSDKLPLFVAIDRTSKIAFVELHQEAGKMVAAQTLRNLIAAVPMAFIPC